MMAIVTYAKDEAMVVLVTFADNFSVGSCFFKEYFVEGYF